MNQDKINELFAGRKLVIATKHEKEKIIAPIISNALNVLCFTNEKIDTDLLGTFSGEIERKNNVIETARKKCQMAIEVSNCDMALASEGSFGPHPSLGFINADDEILMFVDKKHKLEIIVRELSIKTNFNGQEIKTEKELVDFVYDSKFPSHGLIMRKASNDNTEIIKGITDLNLLKKTFNKFKSKYGVAYVETDMRAMYNPMRMAVIETAAQKLAKKITSLCPQCCMPGFGITNSRTGLPCSKCGFPTQSTLAYEYKCDNCNFISNKEFPHGKKYEEPEFCNICNP